MGKEIKRYERRPFEKTLMADSKGCGVILCSLTLFRRNHYAEASGGHAGPVPDVLFERRESKALESVRHIQTPGDVFSYADIVAGAQRHSLRRLYYSTGLRQKKLIGETKRAYRQRLIAGRDNVFSSDCQSSQKTAESAPQE